MKKALCLRMIARWTAAPQCFHPEIDTYADHMSDILQRIEKKTKTTSGWMLEHPDRRFHHYPDWNDEWYTDRIFWSTTNTSDHLERRWTCSFTTMLTSASKWGQLRVSKQASVEENRRAGEDHTQKDPPAASQSRKHEGTVAAAAAVGCCFKHSPRMTLFKNALINGKMVDYREITVVSQ